MIVLDCIWIKISVEAWMFKSSPSSIFLALDLALPNCSVSAFPGMEVEMGVEVRFEVGVLLKKTLISTWT